MTCDDITQAVKSMLYLREEPVIHSLHSVLILLLPVLEGPRPVAVTTPRKQTRTDEVFRILLNSVDFESKILLRKVHCILACTVYIVCVIHNLP